MGDNRKKTKSGKISFTASAQQRSGVVVQAGILAAASILSRIIGLLYRSPLTAIIGDEGNGYYGTAINIYPIFLLVSSFGVPSAISKLMAQKMAVGRYKDAQRVFHCALIYTLAVGAAASLVLYFGAGLLVPPNSVPVLRVFAPTIFLFGLLGSLRGYFQANQTMVQTSVSQILEQVVNAAVSIGGAYFLMNFAAAENLLTGQPGMPYPAGQTARAIRGAMGSALGTGSGVAAALFFMLAVYMIHRPSFHARMRRDRSGALTSYGRIMLETILVITPFILSSIILNLTTSLNQTIFMKLMIGMKGWKEVPTTTIYGLFSNKAVVITNIPISIATAVAAAIIPGISTAYARKDMRDTRKRSVGAIRMTLIIAVPCAVGLTVLARPVTMLLFPQWDTLDTSSSLLSALAVTVIFYSAATIANAALQSIGKMHLPLLTAAIALAVQTVVLILLLLTTNIGAYALVIASILYSVLIFFLDEAFLQYYLHMHIRRGRMYGLPVLSACAMGAVTRAVYQIVFFVADRLTGTYMANLIAIVPAILTAIPVYFFTLIRLHGISRQDVLGMPKGRRLLRVLENLHWM